MNKYIFMALAFSSSIVFASQNQEVKVTVNIVNENGVGELIGEVAIKETNYGLLFKPQLSNLPTGSHGFHIHQNATCLSGEKDGKLIAGLSAGGHWDPTNSKIHSGPYGEGHLGDLPPIFIDSEGKSNGEFLAPRIKSLSEIKGKSIMIHLGGDNHSDHPMPLGGGGARIACGLIN